LIPEAGSPRYDAAYEFWGKRTMPDESMPSETVEATPPTQQLDVPLDSPAISRLIEEVRGEVVDVPRSYNRTFNRHNR
jgi:hypothetical protein